MNYLHLRSWYYQGVSGKSDAWDFFEKLREGTKKGLEFPFDCPYQVAFVHCTIDEHWCVGVLIMRGTAGDDSIEQSDRLNEWYKACGAVPGGDKNTSPATRPSVEGTLQARYGSQYRSIEAFGPLGTFTQSPVTPTSIQQQNEQKKPPQQASTIAAKNHKGYTTSTKIVLAVLAIVFVSLIIAVVALNP